MSKRRKKTKRSGNKAGSQFFNFEKEFAKASQLFDDGKYEETISRCKKLAPRVPHRPEFYDLMLAAAAEGQDKKSLLFAAVKLVEQKPNDPINQYNLHTACLQHILLGLGLTCGEFLLEHWPEFSEAEKVRGKIADIMPMIEERVRKLNLPENEWRELLVLHDRIQIALRFDEDEKVVQLAGELLDRAPHFVPAYNNRSLALMKLRQVDKAIADARAVLTFAPDNYHALSNLIRFLVASDNFEEARSLKEQMLQATSDQLDVWTKKAEAFSFLCDDEAVLQVAGEADKAGLLFHKYTDAHLLHLAGVAAARAGDTKRAHRLWRRALKRGHEDERVQLNLDDLERPTSERQGAWPFNLTEWMPHIDFRKLINELEIAMKGKKGWERAARVAQRFLRDHAEVEALIPALLERGDENGRNTAILIAKLVMTPKLAEALQDFATSSNGSDKTRMEVLHFLRQEERVDHGQALSIWTAGKKREIVHHTFELDDRPYEVIPKEVQKTVSRAFEAAYHGQEQQAEELYRSALAQWPQSASIRLNLAALKVQQGEARASRDIVERIVIDHPNYVFGRCQLAMHMMASDELQQAHEQLNAIMQLEHFHIQEYATFCKTEIFYHALAGSGAEACKKWYEQWQQITPKDPHLKQLLPLTEDSAMARLKARLMLDSYRTQ